MSGQFLDQKTFTLEVSEFEILNYATVIIKMSYFTGFLKIFLVLIFLLKTIDDHYIFVIFRRNSVLRFSWKSYLIKKLIVIRKVLPNKNNTSMDQNSNMPFLRNEFSRIFHESFTVINFIILVYHDFYLRRLLVPLKNTFQMIIRMTIRISDSDSVRVKIIFYYHALS